MLATIRGITEQLGIPTVPYLFFGMRRDYAKEHPDNARAFVAAYQDFYDILMTNDEIWQERGGGDETVARGHQAVSRSGA